MIVDQSYLPNHKCNLCQCLCEDDEVIIVTKNDFIVAGRVEKVSPDCKVVKLSANLLISPVFGTLPLPGNPAFVCCDDIYLVGKIND